MKRALFALVILGLVLALGAPAEAQNYADDTCPDAAGTQFIVDTAAKAATVANGYIKDTCELIIKITIAPISVQQLIIRAKLITIEGDGVTPLNIINPLVGGEVNLIVVGNGQQLRILNATVQARSIIRLFCEVGFCTIDVDDSSIVAADPLGDTNSSVGELFISARFHIDLDNSSIYGGSGLHMASQLGHIFFHCPGPGQGGCRDPLTSGVVQTLCGDPPVFPCNVTFPTANDLRKVCFPGTAGTVCGGGRKEIRISAFLDVDIVGSTIKVFDHITIESITENVLAANSVLTVGDALNVSAKKTVDVQGAVWDAKRITIVTGSGCTGPAICINANKADMGATDLIAMEANNKNGVISVCDHAKLDVPGGNLVVLNGGVCTTAGGAGINTKVTGAQCNPLPGADICQ